MHAHEVRPSADSVEMPTSRTRNDSRRVTGGFPSEGRLIHTGKIVVKRNSMIVRCFEAGSRGSEGCDRAAPSGTSAPRSGCDSIKSPGINRTSEWIYPNGTYALCDILYSEDPVTADLALVAAVLRKDRKATAEFINTYTDAVYSFIRRHLYPRQDLVDDLVQDVFIAAWENLGHFRGSSSLRAWLLGIARHKVEDHYRRLLQEAHPLDAELAEILPDLSADVEAIADRERIERQARKVLDEMPQHYSVALLWRYWERRSAREVAQATGRSEKAVERLLARAREEFRRRWQNA